MKLEASSRLATITWFCAALTGLAALTVLTWHVRHGTTEAFDRSVLNHFSTPDPDSDLSFLIETATWAGSLWVLLPLMAITLAWMMRQGKHHTAALMAIGFFGSVASTWAMKWLMERERPVEWGYLAMQLPQDFSYPSAHTTQVVAFAWVLMTFALPSRPLHAVVAAAVLACIALTVAFSRVYLLVHWPTDIIAGILMALIWVSFALGLRFIDKQSIYKS